MRNKNTLALFVLLCLFSMEGQNQILFWNDRFEDVGSPSSGTRTPSSNHSCNTPATSYFFRTNVTGIALQAGTYSSFEGTRFWAAEDIDAGPTCVNNSISAAQSITWTGINISGRGGLSFRGLFAANGSISGTWESVAFGASQDLIIVEYRIDGGPFVRGLAFFANASTGNTTTLNLDTNNDFVGDGAALGYTFQEFTFNIPTTGTFLDLRVRFFANGIATEEMAIDNFRLLAATTLPIDLSYFGGNYSNNAITLNWKYESESNFSHFGVERSLNGRDFISIKDVSLTDNRFYSFKDLDVTSAAAFYYRLKLVDKDGTFSYSKVIKIHTGANATFSIVGNPATNQLTITGLRPGAVLSVYDKTGKKIIQQNVRDQVLSMDISSLSSGVYYLQYLHNGSTTNKKFIKQ